MIEPGWNLWTRIPLAVLWSGVVVVIIIVVVVVVGLRHLARLDEARRRPRELDDTSDTKVNRLESKMIKDNQLASSSSATAAVPNR